MCACDFNWTCSACRDTRHDPLYFETDDHEQPEQVRPSEYEVRDA